MVGCAIDFAVLRCFLCLFFFSLLLLTFYQRRKKNGEVLTSLVEVNDGFSIGAYEGISSKDYTELLIARWKKLMGK